MKHTLCVLTLTTAKLVRNYQEAKAEYDHQLREYQAICQSSIITCQIEDESSADSALERSSQKFYRAETVLKVHWANLWQRYRHLIQERSQQPPQWFLTELVTLNEALTEISKVSH
jgi:hypothetical protein